MNGQENRGVIEVGQLAKIWRLHLREGMPIKEISRTLGLSRTTVKRWLRAGDMKVPAYPKRSSPSKLDAYKDVRGGGGIRKMRFAVEGRGKSGGVRVIY